MFSNYIVFYCSFAKNYRVKQTSDMKASRKGTIALLAFMVFGLSLSSLINFHLFRIYGSPLNTELIQSKREELATIEISQLAIVDLAHAIVSVNQGLPDVAVLLLQADCFIELTPCDLVSYKAIYSLRAPPLA